MHLNGSLHVKNSIAVSLNHYLYLDNNLPIKAAFILINLFDKKI